MACGHCGFGGKLDEKASATIERETFDDRGQELEWTKTARILRCPSCRGLTLDTYDYADYMDPEDVSFVVVYPQGSRDLSALPERVRVQYEKAQRVESIDANFYAVGVRRTLEAICTDQGFPRAGRQALFDRLDNLAKAKGLPEVFVEMAHHLRDLGNLGAHEDDVEVESADVDVAADFAEAILEYLYRAPAKVARVSQGLLSARRLRKSHNGVVFWRASQCGTGPVAAGVAPDRSSSAS